MKKKILLSVIVVAIVIISGFVLIKVLNRQDESDAIKFAKEYNITEDNIFVYKNAEEIIKILENGTGVVYLGFPECPWCRAYVTMLNEIARENHFDKIYYYNISKDRKENTETYQKIIAILNDHLMYDNEGDKRIYVPDITFMLNGKIIGHDNETSVVTEADGTPEEYWTEQKKDDLRNKLTKSFKVLNDHGGCTSVCDA